MRSKEIEIRLAGYLQQPDMLTIDRIPYYNKEAERIISNCEGLIKQMQEYRKEYFDKERKQLDKLLQPEQIQFTKEEQKVIEEVLKEYMA